MDIGKVRQLTTAPAAPASFDALIERRVTELLADYAATYRDELAVLRDMVTAQADRRWPERFTPALLAAYLGYASSESIPASWKALRHRDPLDGGFFYLKAEVDAELARRAA